MWSYREKLEGIQNWSNQRLTSIVAAIMHPLSLAFFMILKKFSGTPFLVLKISQMPPLEKKELLWNYH